MDPEESNDDETTPPKPSTSAEIVSQESEPGAPPVVPGLWPAVTADSFRTAMVRRGPFKDREKRVFPKSSGVEEPFITI